MLTAKNDTFTIPENYLGGVPAVFNTFYGGLFEDNGAGIDVDGEANAFTITHIDGSPVSGLHVIALPGAGPEIDIVTSSGNFGFYLNDAYRWMPAGTSKTISFNYTIADGTGDTSTATATFIITGVDSNDALAGTSGNDILRAGLGSDTINAGAGNDVCDGGTGNDYILAGAGNDTIIGGAGFDFITAGAGRDQFMFTSAVTFANRDVITDFRPFDDTLRLDNAVFTKLGAAGRFLSAAQFHVGAAAHDANDRIIYNKASGAVLYDANGNAPGGVVQFAILSTKPAGITNADFFII